MPGVLTLIPTPIDDESSIGPEAKGLLLAAFENDDLILVEELKECRRRWLRFGLPREAIENFVLYNEHTYEAEASNCISALKKGKNVYMMSDCGLPAFCDPGRSLVEKCHRSKIQVTATPFANSISLAIALSGFPHNRFIFEGFISAKRELRNIELKKIVKNEMVTILMDTPYRMHKFLDELQKLNIKREIFLGIDLNKPTELLLRGDIESVIKRVPKEKREFILVLGPIDE